MSSAPFRLAPLDTAHDRTAFNCGSEPLDRYFREYVNTLFIQEVLAEPAWHARMTAEDWRALSPLIYHHVNPYGRIELDMSRRLPLAA